MSSDTPPWRVVAWAILVTTGLYLAWAHGASTGHGAIVLGHTPGWRRRELPRGYHRSIDDVAVHCEDLLWEDQLADGPGCE